MNGITVKLTVKTQTGVDALHVPIYSETTVDVADVLVAPASSEDIADAMNLYGKKAVYTLGIPKGDAHDWTDTTVEFFGRKWRTIGLPTEGIEALIPLRWNRKVKVEAYAV